MNQLVNVGNPLYTVAEDKYWKNRIREWKRRRGWRRRRRGRGKEKEEKEEEREDKQMKEENVGNLLFTALWYGHCSAVQTLEYKWTFI